MIQRLVLFIAAVVLLRLPPLLFDRQLREAAIAVDMERLAWLRRMRALVSLVVYVLLGAWLYFLPDYNFGHWKHWLAWAVLIGALMYGFFEMWTARSPAANARYAMRLSKGKDI